MRAPSPHHKKGLGIRVFLFPWVKKGLSLETTKSRTLGVGGEGGFGRGVGERVGDSGGQQ